MKIDFSIAVVAAIVLIILIGQVIVFDSEKYSTLSVENGDGIVDYNIDTNISAKYSLTSLNNGNEYDLDSYYIYFDSEREHIYPESYQNDLVYRATYLFERSNLELQTINTDQLVTQIQTDIERGQSNSAIVFIMGFLPEEVYDGSPDSLFNEWLSIGGIVYWSGETIGKNISNSDGTITECEKFSENIFGVEGAVNNSDESMWAHNTPENTLTNYLGIYFNDCKSGVNPNKINNCLSFDFSKNGYSSVTVSKYYNGSGMLVVFGGNLTSESVITLVYLVAAGVTYQTTVIDHTNSSTVIGNNSGKIKVEQGKTTVFMHMGLMHFVAIDVCKI